MIVEKADVVEVRRIGHDRKWLVVDLFDEWLVAADVIDVIDEAQLLLQRERVGAAQLGAAVVADRALAGRLLDLIGCIFDEGAFVVARHLELDIMAAAMRAAFMTALGDLLGKRGLRSADRPHIMDVILMRRRSNMSSMRGMASFVAYSAAVLA